MKDKYGKRHTQELIKWCEYAKTCCSRKEYNELNKIPAGSLQEIFCRTLIAQYEYLKKVEQWENEDET